MPLTTSHLFSRSRRVIGIALAAGLAAISLCCLGVHWAGRGPGICLAAAEVRTVDVSPGATLPQVAAALEAAGLADATEVELVARDSSLRRALGLQSASLEGYLAPGRFEFELGTPIETLLTTLVHEQRRRLLAPGRRHDAVDLGLSETELLTLASLLERETDNPGERQRLAGQWMARLHHGLRLESSAAHAAAQARAQGRPLAAHDRFDTHQTTGLPPAPIGSPSLNAIDSLLAADASAHPVQFDGGRFAIDTDERRALAAVAADPAPDSITRGIHYYVSNEQRQHNFHDAVSRLGGVHVGVGTDQNYLFAGWSRPELLVLTDFDQAVVDLHRVYRVAFLSADTPRQFFNLWQYAQRKRLRRMVASAYANMTTRDAALGALDDARASVAWRLQTTRDTYAERGVPTFLSDADQYAHLRALFAANRVVMLRADLRADGALQRLGRVFAEHDRTVRTLYLSNAEQYFHYDAAFRRNIQALPYDAFSLVLRTRPVGADYAYVVQSHDDLRAWLDAPRVRHVSRIVPLHDLRVGQRILLAGGPSKLR